MQAAIGRRGVLRAARKWITANITRAGVAAAPRLSPPLLGVLETLVATGGARLPIVSRLVADNMRAAGVYSPEVHRDYFAQIAGHLIGALHTLRYADSRFDGRVSAELCAIVDERVELDESVDLLRAAVAARRGAILVGPHITHYLLGLAALNRDAPLTVYLRHVKDAARTAAKQRWYRATGVGWISEPADTGGALGRLGRMAAGLAAGRTLFITPDLPQKRDDGVPVRFFDREIYLPAGPAILALRTGAPMYLLTARRSGVRQRLIVRGPLEPGHAGRGRAGRRAAVAERMQWFAGHFETFVRAEPALWYLWGDKRWTRVFRGDPRCVRRLDAPLAAGPAVRTDATPLTGAV